MEYLSTVHQGSSFEKFHYVDTDRLITPVVRGTPFLTEAVFHLFVTSTASIMVISLRSSSIIPGPLRFNHPTRFSFARFF